jgi:hypothetical protein
MADGESSMQFPEQVEMVKMQHFPRPSRHFFYERPDGSIIDVSEQEAAIGYKHSQKFRYFKQLGVSNGTASLAFLRACGRKPGEMIPYTEARAIMQQAFAAELESARGHFQAPRLAEWAYPDNSVPQNERAAVSLPPTE